MSKHIRIVSVHMYQVVDSTTGEVVFQTLDPLEANEKAQQ